MLKMKISNDVINGFRCVVLVGGGGKSSIIAELAQRAAAENKSVITTTTTHIYEPGKWYTPSEVIEVQKGEIYCVGYKGKNGKLRGISDDEAAELLEKCELLLIEGDGSRGLPIKAPAEHEPVIPPCAELVIDVIGIDCIGKTIAEACHRPEYAVKIPEYEISADTIITPEIAAALIMSENGGRKNVRCAYKAVINKVNTASDEKKAAKILERLDCEGYISGRPVSAVAMCSGESKRMGKENKLFLEVNGEKMYHHTIELIDKLDFYDKIAVSVYDEILSETKKRGFKAFFNTRANEGISQSVRIGAENAEGDGIMYFTCDQPLLKADTVQRLINKYYETGKIIIPRCGENEYSPCIFPSRLRNELMSLKGDRGGKKVSRKYPELTEYVELDDETELADIDNKDDYEKIRS